MTSLQTFAPSMEKIKATIIQYLNNDGDGEAALLRKIDQLAKREGDSVYQVLLFVLTHLEFDPIEAKEKWRQIIGHQKDVEANLERQVSLATATCDYFSSIKKKFQTPKIVEVDTFEGAIKLSTYDGLTGLYNRGFFEKALSKELKRAKRHDSQFSLIFLDLDNFKLLNDTLGHPAGDMALKSVAKEIIEQKRGEDLAARYGGEEIILILPQTAKNEARIIAERIRKKVEELKLEYQGHSFKLTISGGVASYPMDSVSMEGIVQCADKALYQAKENKKNNITLYTLERRKFERKNFTENIGVFPSSKSHQYFSAKAQNISLEGILFESPTVMNIGSRVLLKLPVTEQNKKVQVVGNVEHTMGLDTPYYIGVSFIL